MTWNLRVTTDFLRIRLEDVGEASVNRTYDLFERLQDDRLLWRMSVMGLENARKELRTLAQRTQNECIVVDVLTREIIERANVPN
jgi:hypothetical protein